MGSSGSFSLRGMGVSQTLVLVNGGRVAGVGSRGTAEGSDQADLNGIPLAAILSQDSERVPGQVYHDLFVRYRLPARNRALADLELALGAKNLFDKALPVDMSTSRYYSTFGDPRMRRIYVNLKKTF